MTDSQAKGLELASTIVEVLWRTYKSVEHVNVSDEEEIEIDSLLRVILEGETPTLKEKIIISKRYQKGEKIQDMLKPFFEIYSPRLRAEIYHLVDQPVVK